MHKIIEKLANLKKEEKICSAFTNLLKDSIPLYQTSRLLSFRSKMKKIYREKCNREGYSREAVRKKYFNRKVTELEQHFIQWLKRISKKTAAGKLVYLYFTSPKASIKNIIDESKIKSHSVIKKHIHPFLNKGFNSFKKEAHDFKKVTQKDRIELSLIKRIRTKKADAASLYIKGSTAKEIAIKFGLSRQTISKWIKDYKEKVHITEYPDTNVISVRTV